MQAGQNRKNRSEEEVDEAVRVEAVVALIEQDNRVREKLNWLKYQCLDDHLLKPESERSVEDPRRRPFIRVEQLPASELEHLCGISRHHPGSSVTAEVLDRILEGDFEPTTGPAFTRHLLSNDRRVETGQVVGIQGPVREPYPTPDPVEFANLVGLAVGEIGISPYIGFADCLPEGDGCLVHSFRPGPDTDQIHWIIRSDNETGRSGPISAIWRTEDSRFEEVQQELIRHALEVSRWGLQVECTCFEVCKRKVYRAQIDRSLPGTTVSVLEAGIADCHGIWRANNPTLAIEYSILSKYVKEPLPWIQTIAIGGPFGFHCQPLNLQWLEVYRYVPICIRHCATVAPGYGDDYFTDDPVVELQVLEAYRDLLVGGYVPFFVDCIPTDGPSREGALPLEGEVARRNDSLRKQVSAYLGLDCWTPRGPTRRGVYIHFVDSPVSPLAGGRSNKSFAWLCHKYRAPVLFTHDWSVCHECATAGILAYQVVDPRIAWTGRHGDAWTLAPHLRDLVNQGGEYLGTDRPVDHQPHGTLRAAVTAFLAESRDSIPRIDRPREAGYALIDKLKCVWKNRLYFRGHDSEPPDIRLEQCGWTVE